MKNPDNTDELRIDFITSAKFTFTIGELADVIVDQLNNDEIIELFREVDARLEDYDFTMEIFDLAQQLKKELDDE